MTYSLREERLKFIKLTRLVAGKEAHCLINLVDISVITEEHDGGALIELRDGQGLRVKNPITSIIEYMQQAT